MFGWAERSGGDAALYEITLNPCCSLLWHHCQLMYVVIVWCMALQGRLCQPFLSQASESL